MTVSTSFGFLRVDQDFQSTSGIAARHFDLVVLFSSYEPRSIEITNLSGLRSHMAVVFKFRAPGEDNSRTEHAKSLLQFAQKIAPHAQIIPVGMSVDVEPVQTSLNKFLQEAVEKFGRPISVLIDVSTCPKIHFLHVVARGIASGIFSSVSAFYAEAEYREPNRGTPLQDSPGFLFTEGEWVSSVPQYLEGRYKPDKPRHVVVAMGADGASVEKLIRRYEPDSMSVLCPIPGVHPAIDEKAKRETDLIEKTFGATEVHRVPAFDLLAAISAVGSIYKEKKQDNDIMLFCLGTKPHALALGLCGIIFPELQVICRIPVRYVERRNHPTGKAWLYNVLDQTSPELFRSEPSVAVA